MTHEDRLADLLVRWEEATAEGRSPTVSDLCHDCPELIPDLRALLARLGPIDAALRADGAPPAPPGERVPTIDAGRYRPLSFHRAGGLGVVFVAEDDELRRT